MNGEEIAGTLHEKELQNANQTEFRTEKVRKKQNLINGSLSRKVMIIRLIVTGWFKKRLEQKISQYFLELHECPCGNLKTHLDQSNHATKTYWNGATGTDIQIYRYTENVDFSITEKLDIN